MCPDEIPMRCLSNLRALWRTIRKFERLYPEFPDAPGDTWCAGIRAVAEQIKTMTEAELSSLGGSYTALRNLVADQMGLERSDEQGHSYSLSGNS